MPKTALPRSDTLDAKDRWLEAKNQGHKQKIRPSKIFLRRSQKKRSSKIFLGDHQKKKTVEKKNFQPIYKILLFKKQCCPRAEDRAIFEDSRLRRTSKWVLEDSTFVKWTIKSKVESSNHKRILLFVFRPCGKHQITQKSGIAPSWTSKMIFISISLIGNCHWFDLNFILIR